MRTLALSLLVLGAAAVPAAAKDTTQADLAKLLKAQFDAYLKDTANPSVYTDDAKLMDLDSVDGWDGFTDGNEIPHASVEGRSYKRHTDSNVQVVVARDGNTAWISFGSKVHFKHGKYAGLDEFDTDYRITEIAVKTPKGWRIAAGMWSTPTDNARVNKAAKAGKQSDGNRFEGGDGDESLQTAFTKLTTGPLDATAAARKDLVAYGSGPGERTVGGAVLAKAWAAAWANHLTIVDNYVAEVAPSGTTGWVIADVLLDKKTYKVRFRVLFVFDKDAAGAWSVVHAHFATTE